MTTTTYALIPADAAIARMWLAPMCNAFPVSFVADVHASSLRTSGTKHTARHLGSSPT